MKIITIILLQLFVCEAFYGQSFTGIVKNKKSGQTIEYVNVGVKGKSIGTVSNEKGVFVLAIDSQYDNDSILFSCIGFFPFSMKVSDFKKQENHEIYLNEKIIQIKEVVIRKKQFKEKTLGISTKTKHMFAGFKDNKLGYELGVFMKVNKCALLERVHLNIANTSYDSVFYRLNVYKSLGKNQFVNILEKPIYLSLSKEQIKETITIDLLQYNIIVNGDFMISVEHVKDLGKGSLNFSAQLFKNTYYRETSQAIWETAPAGVSISADVRVEK